MSENITSRQSEIIQAAGKILTQSGVGGLTIKNLAKEMRFSEGAIYRHFSSKEKIILAMLSHSTERLDLQYEKVLTEAEHPAEQFSVLFRNQFMFFNANPYFATAVFSDGLMEHSFLINQAILNLMEIQTKHLKPIILKGQHQNTFTTNITTDDIIHIALGAVRLLMYKWRVANFDFDLTVRGDKLIQSLLETLKR